MKMSADSEIVGEGVFGGFISRTRWTVTRKAAQFDTVYHSPFDSLFSTKHKVFSLSGVHSADAVHVVAHLWETQPISLIIMSPIVFAFWVICRSLGDDKSHFVVLKMISGNTILLNDHTDFAANSAQQIVDAIRISISSSQAKNRYGNKRHASRIRC